MWSKDPLFLEWKACWGVGKVNPQHCQIAVTFSSLPDQLGNSCVVSLLILQEELHHTIVGWQYFNEFLMN